MHNYYGPAASWQRQALDPAKSMARQSTWEQRQSGWECRQERHEGRA